MARAKSFRVRQGKSFDRPTLTFSSTSSYSSTFSLVDWAILSIITVERCLRKRPANKKREGNEGNSYLLQQISADFYATLAFFTYLRIIKALPKNWT